MSKVCIVNYGADEKNGFSVSDLGDLRIINCALRSSEPGFFLRKKIRRFSRGYSCFDKFSIADDVVCPDHKGLFKRDIAYLVKKYCEVFGLDSNNYEISVYGTVTLDAVKSFSQNFSMVWLYGDFEGEYYNTFAVKSQRRVKTYFSVYADDDFDIPDSEVIFNLTDKKIPSVNNIEVYADGLCGVPSLYRNEAVRLSGTSYNAISFIK